MKKIIALDLDGTLLGFDRKLSPGNLAALRDAAEQGAEIVPATGRFYKGMPEEIRDLSFVNYAITINGAQVIDVRTGGTVYSALIHSEEAVGLLEYLDTLPVLYDCYYDGWGYMTEEMQNRAAEFISSDHVLKMVLTLRSPVPELKAWIREERRCPQKIQVFTGTDTEYRDEVLRALTDRYPQFSITSSNPNNIEINSRDADKGIALLGLARALGIDREDTIAFGDGLNDLSMVKAAGIGVAMANGCREIKEAADMITEDCGSDGVAAGIKKLLGNSIQ